MLIQTIPKQYIFHKVYILYSVFLVRYIFFIQHILNSIHVHFSVLYLWLDLKCLFIFNLLICLYSYWMNPAKSLYCINHWNFRSIMFACPTEKYFINNHHPTCYGVQNVVYGLWVLSDLYCSILAVTQGLCFYSHDTFVKQGVLMTFLNPDSQRPNFIRDFSSTLSV